MHLAPLSTKWIFVHNNLMSNQLRQTKYQYNYVWMLLFSYDSTVLISIKTKAI